MKNVNVQTFNDLAESLLQFDQVVCVVRQETKKFCLMITDALKKRGIDIQMSTAPEAMYVDLKTDASERGPYDIETLQKLDISIPTLALIEATIVQRNITIIHTIERLRRMISSVYPVALVYEDLSHTLMLTNHGRESDPDGYGILLQALERKHVPVVDITTLEPLEIFKQSVAALQH